MLAPARRVTTTSVSLFGWIVRIVDGFAIASGLATAAWVLSRPDGDYVFAATIAIGLYYLCSEITGVYRSWRGATRGHEITCVLITWGLTATLMVAAGWWLTRLWDMPRSLMAIWFVLSPVFVVTGHAILRSIRQWLHSKGFNTQNIAIVGANELAFQLARNVQAAPEMGLRLVGFYDDRPADRRDPLPDDVGAFSGDIAQLIFDAKRALVHRIYIAFPMRAENRIKAVLSQLADTTASVYIVPDFYVFQLLHSRWTTVGSLPAVSVFENPLYGVDGALKRATDLVLASVAMLLLAIPMALVALAIKLTSRGPVFFRQKRYGLDGREILVWKFRSMKVLEDGAEVTQATRNDPRLTSIGGFIRRTSIDELPQLFNVFEGTMSLVGPRPHAKAHNEFYRGKIHGYMLRHKVKPGITGLAQVNGWRGETDTIEKMEKRIEFDHRYIREWSWWLDWEILFRTIFVVLGRKNAY